MFNTPDQNACDEKRLSRNKSLSLSGFNLKIHEPLLNSPTIGMHMIHKTPDHKQKYIYIVLDDNQIFGNKLA